MTRRGCKRSTRCEARAPNIYEAVKAFQKKKKKNRQDQRVHFFFPSASFDRFSVGRPEEKRNSRVKLLKGDDVQLKENLRGGGNVVEGRTDKDFSFQSRNDKTSPHVRLFCWRMRMRGISKKEKKEFRSTES